jgi:hypothetical protein
MQIQLWALGLAFEIVAEPALMRSIRLNVPKESRLVAQG